MASVIHGEDVDIVDTYKCLGTIFDSSLRFDINAEAIVKKGQQRTHLLRKLNPFNVSKPILCTVYLSYIESLLTFSFVCWFGALSVKDKNSLGSVVKVCSKITGVKLIDLNSLWKRRVLQKAVSIINSEHALSNEFTLMTSGRRYLPPHRKTNRYSSSFIPSAIQLLNAE